MIAFVYIIHQTMLIRSFKMFDLVHFEMKRVNRLENLLKTNSYYNSSIANQFESLRDILHENDADAQSDFLSTMNEIALELNDVFNFKV